VGAAGEEDTEREADRHPAGPADQASDAHEEGAEDGEEQGRLEGVADHVVTSGGSRGWVPLVWDNAREGWGRSRSVVVAGVHVEARDAFGPEHGDVAAVVFDGEAQLEAVGAQVPDGRFLELAGEVVVPEGAHDEEVPAD